MGIIERIDAITGISPEYRGEVLPAPKSVKIELTARCNFKCSFCARSYRLREQKEMDRALFERLLYEMRDAGVEEIGLFYLGESFMCDWLEEAIHFAKHEAKFPYVFLTTNGSLARPERVKACIEAGLDSLKFSLNYADASQFELIARVKRSMFDDMLENIKAARLMRDYVKESTGHNCGLYASYIAYDGEQGERMEGMVAEMQPYLDEIYALPLYNQAGFVTKAEQEAGMLPEGGNRGRLDNLREGIPCWALFTESHITWDGKVTGCCFSHTPDFDFGDATKDSFMDCWNSERAQWFRRHHLAKKLEGTPCERCFQL